MNCRHCQKAKISRPRDLCWECYNEAGVRDLYPSTSKYSPMAARAESEQLESIPPEPCNRCEKPCDPERHNGYCLSCIRVKAGRHRCRTCRRDTFNASRFCVACIREAEAKAEGKVTA